MSDTQKPTALDSREIPWSRAEEILGRRVDRRRKYALVEGNVCEHSSYSGVCSGCYEGYEYGGNGVRGSGCSECGYTGRSRNFFWAPVSLCDAAREAAA
jgi:hypothetical protein